MSYSVDLEDEYLAGKNETAARGAAECINRNGWAKHHMKAEAVERPLPPEQPSWFVDLIEFAGCSWNSEAADELWSALAPHLADDSYLEFRGESADRWRVRWEGGRVYEEFIQAITWKVAHEILPPQEGVTP